MKRRTAFVCALAITTALLIALITRSTNGGTRRTFAIDERPRDDKHQHNAHRRSPNHSVCSERLREGRCSFRGNSDYYGFGIRLGYYLQYAATIVNITWRPDKHKESALAFLAFIIAEFIALFVISFRDACTFDAEVITILYLTTPGVMSMQIYLISHLDYLHSGIFHDQGPRSVGVTSLYQFSLNVLLGFSCWFWGTIAWGNKNVFEPTPCGTSLFLVARLHGYKYLGAATGLVVLSFWILILNSLIIGHVLVALIVERSSPGKENGPKSRPREESAAGNRSSQLQEAPEQFQITRKPTNSGARSSVRKMVVKTLFACGVGSPHVLLLALSIIAVELQFHWNSVSDIYSLGSTGQFIPLIIGIFSILQLPSATSALPRRLLGVKEQSSDGHTPCSTPATGQATGPSRSIAGDAEDVNVTQSSAEASGQRLPKTQERLKRQATV